MFPFGSRNRIIGLVANNEYQALHCVSEDLGIRLSHHGYIWQIIDLAKPGGAQELDAILSLGDTAFAYGYAGVGSQLTQGDTNLWTARRIPFVALWYDHPCYNYKQHIVPSPFVLSVYHLREHYEARKKYLPAGGPAIVLPPTGGVLDISRKIPWNNKERALVFVRTPHDPTGITKTWDTYPPILRNLLYELAREAQNNSNIDLADVTAAVFHRDGHPLDNLDNFFGVIQEVDHYIRIWRSDRLARALLDYPAKIVGDGWGYIAGKSHRAALLPSIPSNQFVSFISKHRITVNSHPLWRDGIHERVFLGMGCGNVILTDRTEKSDALFGALPNYTGFNWNDDLADAIDAAWEKAADNKDYFDASTEIIRDHLTLSKENFVQPLEKALLSIYAD